LRNRRDEMCGFLWDRWGRKLMQLRFLMKLTIVLYLTMLIEVQAF